MTKDAKQAAKLEKKLKILLGGYQVSCQWIFVMMEQHWLSVLSCMFQIRAPCNVMKTQFVRKFSKMKIKKQIATVVSKRKLKFL